MQPKNRLSKENLPGLSESTHKPEAGAVQKVQIYISCRDLKNLDIIGFSDPFVQVYKMVGGKGVLVGETEVVKDSLNPDFATTITLDYVFQEKQLIQFEIFDKDWKKRKETIGHVTTTLGHLMGAPRQTAIYEIKKKNAVRGKLLLRAEIIKNQNDEGRFTIKGNGLNLKNGLMGKHEPFFQLRRTVGSHSDVLVYQSEVHGSESTVQWKPFAVSLQTLCNHDYDQDIFLQVFYKKGHENKLIGECKFSINLLKSGDAKELDLEDPKTKKLNGYVEFVNFSLINKVSFLEYLKGGIQLNMMVGIDFTSSNKDQKNPKSLHAMKKNGELNDYQTAIRDVCEILLCYDYDKNVPVYGFGGRPAWRYGVDHCFALNEDDLNPYVSGLDGILTIYRRGLRKITLGQPTLFKELIEKAMEMARDSKNEGSPVYTVLLILTDGMINDMTTTTDLLAECAHLPISVIIVGIGDGDFDKMVTLDGDEKRNLIGSKGDLQDRDVVQFVPYNKFKGKGSKNLAREVLAELPTQFLQYMELMGMAPPPIQQSLYQFQPTLIPALDMNFAPPLSEIALTVSQKYVPNKQAPADDEFDIPDEYGFNPTELQIHSFSPFLKDGISKKPMKGLTLSSKRL